MTLALPSRRQFCTARLIAGALALAALAVPAALSRGEAGAAPIPIDVPATTLDLPAMVIRPSDLPGQGYGVVEGDVYSGIGSSISEYSGSVGLPNPATAGETLSRKILSAVVLYPDDAAAQARLDEDRGSLAGDELTAPRQLVEGAPVVGDDSFTTTFVGETVDGTGAGQNLEVTMRAGSIVAQVGISDFTGGAPTFEELAPLAEVLLGRARDGLAQGTVGLSHRMVRLADTEPWTGAADFESFQVLGGVYLPGSTDPPDVIQARSTFFTTGRVASAYTYQQELEHAASGELLSFNTWLYTFATEADAAAYLEFAANDAVANPGSRTGVARVEVAGASGPAVAVSMGFPLADGQTIDGHRVWVQAGPMVVSVLMIRVGGVPVDAVRDIANAQVACAQSADICQKVAVAAVLLT